MFVASFVCSPSLHNVKLQAGPLLQEKLENGAGLTTS